MRIANAAGRAALELDGRLFDLEHASQGRFPADPMQAVAEFEAVRDFAAAAGPAPGEPLPEGVALGPCVPRPRSVFGIGLNYRDHAEEAGIEVPRQPLVFTKFPSCLAGPHDDVPLTSDRVDWEVELVAVVGRGGRGIAERDALSHVAGYCVGQDVSDRRMQFSGRPPQFSLGKSADGFGPIGPAWVSLDAIAHPDDLAITCDLDGERVQDGRTRDMIFGVAELVAFLSQWCTLAPGDLVFTGTPAGVGSTRKPPRYLAPGQTLDSHIEGLGALRNRCVAA